MSRGEKKRTATLDELLERGNISYFGYRSKTLPDVASMVRSGRTRAFVRKRHQLPKGTPYAKASVYERLSDIRDEQSDVYFLDHEAVKVLFADFPASAQFVLIRFIPRLSWLVALPGLLRRLQIRLIEIEGIRTFNNGEKREKWLVLRHRKAESLHTRLCLSSTIGIEGLLKHLKNEKREYVALRFYNMLPSLHREGGDLDLLVSDEDERAVKEFLKENPGPIGIDVWTVSRISHNAITYYPPPLAREILRSRVEGPAGSYIPGKKEAFLSFAYHIVYHKGLFSGVPTTLPKLVPNPNPENDYQGELLRLAREAGITVEPTLEAIDDCLSEHGWRPQLDTLAKIAPRNKWVWHRFFAGGEGTETGLSIIIVKKKAVEEEMLPRMRERIVAYPDFRILREKAFSPKEVERVRTELRGGVWNDSSGAVTDYLPAYAFAVINLRLAKAGKLGATHEDKKHGIKHLKKLLRKEFDTDKTSFTHATDYAHEAHEYLAVAFPEEAKKVEEEVRSLIADMELTPFERMRHLLGFLPQMFLYRLRKLRARLRSSLVSFVMEK